MMWTWAGTPTMDRCFPGNIVMKFLWENPCGYLKKDQMHSIVTSGAGLFGPNMRVGTKAEICVVDIRFEGEVEEPWKRAGNLCGK